MNGLADSASVADSISDSGIELNLSPSDPAWLAAVLADFPAFLRDHASCEKKAAGMAMNIASHYPDKPELLAAMADLAVEETSHYREVIKLLISRGEAPGADARDPYVGAMNQLIRKGPEFYLLDRLLVASLIEARGQQRFAMIADAVQEATLAKFYQAIAASEARHWVLFAGLAERYFSRDLVRTRFAELQRAEATLIAEQAPRAALH